MREHKLWKKIVVWLVTLAMTFTTNLSAAPTAVFAAQAPQETTQISKESQTNKGRATSAEKTTAQEKAIQSQTSKAAEGTTGAKKAQPTQPETSTEQKSGNTLTKFTAKAKDGTIVSASLAYASDVPQGTILEVNPLTKKDAAFKAYLAAMNSDQKGKKTYTAKNTLFYDVSFIGANGQEIEPKNSVIVNFKFKDQLKKDLRAKRNTDIEVAHLPVKAAAKAKAAADLTKRDIEKEDITDKATTGVSVREEEAMFKVGGFSVFAVTNKNLTDETAATDTSTAAEAEDKAAATTADEKAASTTEDSQATTAPEEEQTSGTGVTGLIKKFISGIRKAPAATDTTDAAQAVEESAKDATPITQQEDPDSYATPKESMWVTADGIVFKDLDKENHTANAYKYRGTSGIVTIPSAVVDPDGNVYTVTKMTAWNNYSWDKVQEITIPDSVTEIQAQMFGSSLTKATISGNVKTLGRIFSGCTNLKDVTIPDTVESLSGTFNKCSSLESINMPSKLKSIGASTFEGCTALKAIDIPETVEEISSYAFRNCSSLTEIKLPSAIKTLAKGEFSGCSNLTKIEMSGNITEIPAEAFRNDAKLTSIPIDMSKVTSIGSMAFSGCSALAFDNGVLDLSSLKTIEKKARSWDQGAFQGCKGITSIKLGEGLQIIPTDTFRECSNVNTIEIPNSVTEIQTKAFYKTDAQTITIGSDDSSNLTKIGASAFTDNSAGSKITINTSKSNVTIGNNAFGTQDNVKWTIPSIDTDDKIAEGGLTLQEAINEAAATLDKADDTIILKKDVMLSDGIKIPKGANITIKTEDDTYTVCPNPELKDPLFTVPQNSTLTFDGGVILNGLKQLGNLIKGDGGDVAIKNGTFKGAVSGNECNKGAIIMDGGNLAMTGGIIE